MKAINILWDVDIEDVLELFDNMSCSEVAEALEINENVVANMTTSEINDYAYELFKTPESRAEILNLPTSVEILDEIATDPDYEDDKEGLYDYISDWLSDTYNFCHSGFQVEED